MKKNRLTSHTAVRASGSLAGVLRKIVTLVLAAALAVPAVTFAEGGPEDSKWRIRARVIGIIPDVDSDNIDLAAGGARVPLTAGVDVDEAFTPEVDITYMFTPHIGIEAIAGTAQHDVSIDGSDAVLNSLGVDDGFEIFDTWVLPPTFTLQYHFTPSARIRPYVGLGVNYTAFLFDDATGGLERTLGSAVDVDTDSSWGWAAQFGVDWDLGGNWFANVDVKYIEIETTASLLVKNLGASLRVDLDVNPWVAGVGVGYRF